MLRAHPKTTEDKGTIGDPPPKHKRNLDHVPKS